ncbi:MAG: hemerythrin domain-containing protein [Rhodanobacteraceae bacterium]|nr:MAG: hemerythrin domain-containing protein [Rhodanobacteraceae bacterium]
MTATNQDLLTAQHRSMELGIRGLVDGSGSRRELTDAVYLLRRHIYVEEAFLFPVIELDQRRLMALAQMRYEHGDMWPHLESALDLLTAKAPLDDLLPASAALLNLLRIHDRKEEEAIYSVADRYPADAASPALAALLATNGIPANWKCRYAPG